MSMIRWKLSVRGIVQGVGFRPFVYNLARGLNLRGSVINTVDGVEIDVEGERAQLDIFMRKLKDDAPRLAKIEDITLQHMRPAGYSGFFIGETIRTGGAQTLVSVDAAVCQDCLKEMLDPADRRYKYPFINCTNCGPRFTIIKDVPYDRQYTTMNKFAMCDDCSREYHDPADRRFHAEPNACPVCGPRVVLRDSSGGLVDSHDPIGIAAGLLKDSSILAVKGLGGYHLVCNAIDNEAVSILRERKVREDKPFAVMVRDIEQARQYCHVSEEEAELLSAMARPIVLLRKLNNRIAQQVAPGNAFLGLMLPYTPVHYLLFAEIDFPLVMTSGNLSDEPIAYEDTDALMRLGEIADYFLFHNREICHRCDDSVTRVFRGREYPVRRSRGYTPAPVRLPGETASILAVGAEQKNTFCLTKGANAFISHHIGDLENLETLLAFEREIAMYKKLFNVEPEIIAYDYHPEYLSTKYAMDQQGVRKTGVQHHHAHIAACMTENSLGGSVIGVALDGTGFGYDGAIWGGEFLYASLADFRRAGHLDYVPMPGGAKAIREPWRMAAGYLHNIFGSEWRDRDEVKFLSVKNGMVLDALGEAMDKWINCPPTSSMGRLFDAVAALIGVRDTVNYEGQAAVELEQMAFSAGRTGLWPYEFTLQSNDDSFVISTEETIKGILADLKAGTGQDVMAYKFHVTVKDVITNACIQIRERYGEERVCLSGGVFQNMLLLDMVYSDLEKHGFRVYVHRVVPANDGGISLGQAIIADERRKAGCV